ncbi:uncharacterized protein LOC126793181 [Argentina anserina]|uniref:uncharacterized protein LOC126793181 n=1 Tax=Argentina anserina TaxID=57926 RepID=UPI00217625AA|nr:uncharacterized protein LOC126793181 [Potentilla anserina]
MAAVYSHHQQIRRLDLLQGLSIGGTDTNDSLRLRACGIQCTPPSSCPRFPVALALRFSKLIPLISTTSSHFRLNPRYSFNSKLGLLGPLVCFVPKIHQRHPVMIIQRTLLLQLVALAHQMFTLHRKRPTRSTSSNPRPTLEPPRLSSASCYHPQERLHRHQGLPLQDF